MLATMAMIITTAAVTRRMSESTPMAMAAGITLLLSPCVLWYGGSGFSDPTGASASLAVLFALLVASDRRGVWYAVVPGVFAAVAIGIRSQSVFALVPMAIVAVIVWKQDRARKLIGGVAGALALSILIWAPAIFITGPRRWWDALVWQIGWVRQERAAGLALPYASIEWIVDGWFLKPFGSPWLACLFWGLTILGAAALWIVGKKRLLLICSCVGVVSLFVALWTLDLRNGQRYIITSLPYFAVLSVGGLHPNAKRWVRGVASFGLASFVIGSISWTVPGLILRSSEPSPVWKVLNQVREIENAGSSIVFFDPKLQPHAEWILGRVGFDIRLLTERDAWERTKEGSPDVIVIRSNNRPPPPNARFYSRWESPAVKTMTPGRYLACWAVAEPAFHELD
jgi:4-amino-4-deoxy-L-arabinose transferase-like glycosyltransferase